MNKLSPPKYAYTAGSSYSYVLTYNIPAITKKKGKNIGKSLRTI